VTGSAHDYVIGFGSNLGNRLEFFRIAVRHLQDHAQITAFSALYETVAVGPAQPDYLNAAVRLHCCLEPMALLSLQLEIERRAGRVRTERWGPRTLDLDLLFVVGQTVNQPSLVVPHCELTRRAFALLPLLDVMPDAREPSTGRAYADLAANLDRTGVRELENSRAGWLE
jgi:2-amino-4-hydroxy-6-hydroxymethyldihydropteridine diphosphokinase